MEELDNILGVISRIITCIFGILIFGFIFIPIALVFDLYSPKEKRNHVIDVWYMIKSSYDILINGISFL